MLPALALALSLSLASVIFASALSLALALACEVAIAAAAAGAADARPALRSPSLYSVCWIGLRSRYSVARFFAPATTRSSSSDVR